MTVQKVAFYTIKAPPRASPPIGSIGLDANLGPPLFQALCLHQKPGNHLDIPNPISLLHFVAFFHVASLLPTVVDNEKVGVDVEKSVELDNIFLIATIESGSITLINYGGGGGGSHIRNIAVFS